MVRKALTVAFPKSLRTKKSTIISDGTYALALRRGQVRSRLRAVGRELKNSVALCCLRAWKTGKGSGMWTILYGFLPRDACWSRAMHLQWCIVLDSQVHDLSCRDKSAHMEGLADQMALAARTGNSKALYDCIKKITAVSRPRGPRCISSTDGMAVLSFTERQRRFR